MDSSTRRSLIFLGGMLLVATAHAATRTWIGDPNTPFGTTDSWAAGGNWAEGVAPVPGDDLVFESGSTHTVNDFPADWNFASISVTNRPFHFTGNPVRAERLTISQGTPVTSARFSGMSIRTALTTVSGAGLLIFGGEIAGVINLSDSYLEPRNDARVGELFLTNNSILNMTEFSDSERVQASAESLSFDQTSLFVIRADPQNSSRMTVAGQVVLANARLQYHLADPLGEYPSEITIINNLGTDAVSGVFAGFPEGTVLAPSDLRRFTISYKGGDGNDVVLRLVQLPTSTVEISTSPNPSVKGQPITFTAKVRTTGDAPTGEVGFALPPSPIGIAHICSAPLNTEGVATCTSDRFSDYAGRFTAAASWPGTATYGSRSPYVTHLIVETVPTLDLRMLALMAVALAAIATMKLTAR